MSEANNLLYVNGAQMLLLIIEIQNGMLNCVANVETIFSQLMEKCGSCQEIMDSQICGLHEERKKICHLYSKY